ncbi:hypothetical protein FA13DRAFT_1812518 [Coprinellus micaceus]|uniref:Nephrocystin 3-like N-terminal domain-containing protein n=1 Tax=Coprinellus micaceus TaxID=71717 RepID=A0A4Y7TKE3_COPMI|nr:hypothetical protein FA13DRAFT_1812518 [Coprinellus micaceus]
MLGNNHPAFRSSGELTAWHCRPTMLEGASSFHTEEIIQINAERVVLNNSRVHQGNSPSHVQVNAREYHHHEATASSLGLRELYRHIASGALHNSADRFDAPKCHPETRKAVQEDILSWAGYGNNDDDPMQLLWLSGPAGSGKTAIMGTISDKFREEGRLAATFFFSSVSGSTDRQSKRRLVTTLAYQLQQQQGLEPHLSHLVSAAIRKDPAIFDKNLKEQMEDSVNDHAFPFRVIISSRPEHHIRHFFTTLPANYTAQIFLDDKYQPDDDITLFLSSKFAEIRRRYDHLPPTWPTESNIRTLVERASGQFIYVATVIRFIDTPPKLPQDQLNIVLKIRPPEGTNPFASLDALYTSILMSSPDPHETVLWLRAYLILQRAYNSWGNVSVRMPAWIYDRFFESTAGQAQMLLQLPSLVHLVELGESKTISISNATYALYHKSFPDFLEDPRRMQRLPGHP